jgi:hypothetical protein
MDIKRETSMLQKRLDEFLGNESEIVDQPQPVADAASNQSGGILGSIWGGVQWLFGYGKKAAEDVIDTNDDGKVDSDELKAAGEKVGSAITPVLELIKGDKGNKGKDDEKKDKKPKKKDTKEEGKHDQRNEHDVEEKKKKKKHKK